MTSPTQNEANQSPSNNTRDKDPWPSRRPGLIQQPPGEGSRPVRDELEKVASLCRKKVERLASQFRSRNRRFRDVEFDLAKDSDLCLNSLSTGDRKYVPADCLRTSQIHDNPKFIINGFRSGNIIQGSSGNCWFLSAMATLSSIPHLIEKICVARDEQIGIYGFVFCRDGKWVDVIIDDQLYTSVPRWDLLSPESQLVYHNDKDLYENIAQKGNKTLYFARSSQEGETWVSLLEKAYAKLHGDYDTLDGGCAYEALEDLTGGVSELIYPNDIFDKDEFWNSELLQAAKDRLFGCYIGSFSGKGPSGLKLSNGLVSDHAYSVLKAVEYNGKRFIKLRSPWGKSEWSCRWSDGSKEWTTEWLPALDLLDHRFGDDGSFIMEYGDFLKTWKAIQKTKLLDESWMHSSHWLNVKPRPFPCPWQYGDISFTFTLSGNSPCIIVLSQADFRFWDELSGPYAWMFDCILFKKGGDEPLASSENSIRWPRSVVLSKVLQAGNYVLHVRLDRIEAGAKDFIKDSLPHWDERKLSRVKAELAYSASMAANYSHRKWCKDIVIPPEHFVGKDLLQLEKECFDATATMRKSLKRQTTIESSDLDSRKVAHKQQWQVNGLKTDHPMAQYQVDGYIQEHKDIPFVQSPGCSSPVETNGKQPNNVNCDGCNTSLTIGLYFRCLECDFNLCESCVASSDIHAPDHHVVKLLDSEDVAELEPERDNAEENNPLLLGLRVYTQHGANASISGQLRHGTLFTWAARK